MTQIDPEREKRRLEEFYAGQMDGELEKVAKQAYELTDIAREALKSELSRRGLAAELVEVHPAPPAPIARPAPVVVLGDPPKPEPEEEVIAEDSEIELRRLVTIRKFRDLPEALLAKGSLESAGIEVVLTDDNVIRLDWFWSNLMGGIKLKVNADDEVAAEEILSQPIPENFDVSGLGQYQQPHCPSCQSLDVNFQELAPAAYVSTMVVGVPIPFHRRAWRCHSCKVEWEDDGIPGPVDSGA